MNDPEVQIFFQNQGSSAKFITSALRRVEFFEGRTATRLSSSYSLDGAREQLLCWALRSERASCD